METVKYVLGAICHRGSVTVQQLAVEVAAARRGAVKAFLFRHFIGKEKAISYTRDTLEYGLTAVNGILTAPRGCAPKRPEISTNWRLSVRPRLKEPEREREETARPARAGWKRKEAGSECRSLEWSASAVSASTSSLELRLWLIILDKLFYY